MQGGTALPLSTIRRRPQKDGAICRMVRAI